MGPGSDSVMAFDSNMATASAIASLTRVTAPIHGRPAGHLYCQPEAGKLLIALGSASIIVGISAEAQPHPDPDSEGCAKASNRAMA